MRTRQKEGDFVQAFVDIYGDWNNDTIKSAIKAALEYEKIDVDCSVEVTIEDEQGIREINKQYRNIDRVTDVLSFPMFEDKSEICVDSSNTAFLGSMVICRQRAEQQRAEHNGQHAAQPIAIADILSVSICVFHAASIAHPAPERNPRTVRGCRGHNNVRDSPPCTGSRPPSLPAARSARRARAGRGRSAASPPAPAAVRPHAHAARSPWRGIAPQVPSVASVSSKNI